LNLNKLAPCRQAQQGAFRIDNFRIPGIFRLSLDYPALPTCDASRMCLSRRTGDTDLM
jgi:hypothetical protein